MRSQRARWKAGDRAVVRGGSSRGLNLEGNEREGGEADSKQLAMAMARSREAGYDNRQCCCCSGLRVHSMLERKGADMGGFCVWVSIMGSNPEGDTHPHYE